MKKISGILVGLLIAFVFLYPVPESKAAFIPTSDTVSIRGSQSARTNIMLMADMRGNALVSTFRNLTDSPNSNTGYTPSGGNKFYATGIIVQSVAGGNNPDVHLGYGDTNVNFGSSSLPTNAWGIGFGTMSAISDNTNMLNFDPAMTSNSISPTAYIQELPILITFPNGKYPFVVWNNNLSAGDTVMMFGYEAP